MKRFTDIFIRISKMNQPTDCGFLSVTLGPMWSGKTSTLVDKYKQCQLCHITTLPINYDFDTRYGDNVISTHDERKIPCCMVNKLSDISNICGGELTEAFIQATVILINEAQFFKDIKEWVICAVETHHKHIYICGLDGDFKKETFGNFLELIPYCDEIVKLKSICMKCKVKSAIFTQRINEPDNNAVDKTTQIVIGTSIYKPLCRLCYKKVHE